VCGCVDGGDGGGGDGRGGKKAVAVFYVYVCLSLTWPKKEQLSNQDIIQRELGNILWWMRRAPRLGITD